MSEIYPGILAHTFEEYTDRLQLIEASSAAWVHVDVMDGQFVPNITVMPHEIMSVATRLKVEMHLMVSNPERYFSDLSVIGCDRVLLHRESFATQEEWHDIIKKALDYFPEVGAAFNPHTPLETVQDTGAAALMIMGVEPGYSGQTLLEGTYDRLQEARQLNDGLVLAIDGGVSEETIKPLQEAGAQRFVISSHLFANNAVPQNFTYFTQLLTGGTWAR